MKIAFFLNEFPCLSQTFILNQVSGLLDRGHEVEIFANQPGSDSKVHEDIIEYNLLSRTCYHRAKLENMPRSKLYRIIKALGYLLIYTPKRPVAVFNSLNVLDHGRKALSFQLFFQILPFLTKSPYDIIHCHFGPLGNLVMFLKELGAISGKLITSFHGYDMSSYINSHGENVYNKLFNNGDLFLPISKLWKNKLVKMGCREDKIIVHKMGIDLRLFKFRKKTNTQDKTVRILTVARLTEKKGIEYGIKAIKNIIGKYPEVQYEIVGDGPSREDLVALICKLGVSKNVKLLGSKNQDEISQLMSWADILLAPSVTSEDGDQEGIPVVLMEAAARGLPVVSSYHSGIPEVVVDGISGFLSPERDVDKLTSNLKHLITRPDLREKMGVAGRKHVEEHHNIETLNDRLVDIYKKLLL